MGGLFVMRGPLVFRKWNGSYRLFVLLFLKILVDLGGVRSTSLLA
jgi:hypothetical protein